MDKFWLKYYPEGVPEQINSNAFLSVTDMVEECCAKYKDLKAITNMGTSLTYSELDQKTEAFAAYLQQVLHLKKGDRIAIMLPNSLQNVIAILGALKAGLIVVNVNPLYTQRELTHQLLDSEVESVVIMANFAKTLELCLPDLKIKNIIITELGDLFSFPKRQLVNFVVKRVKRMVPSYHLPNPIPFRNVLNEGKNLKFEPVAIDRDDIAFLQYTGGTTGVAKGAILTHRNIFSNSLQVMNWSRTEMKEGAEHVVLPLPIYHIFALQVVFEYLLLGSNIYLITNPRDIPGFVKELKHIPFTFFVGINTLCRALVMNEEFQKLDFSHLRHTVTGGMSTSPDVAADWHRVTGVPILQGYGLTETSPVISVVPFNDPEFDGSIGLPMPSTEVEVRDFDGKPVPLGEIGELWVKGPQVMQGYWKMPEETALVLTSDGWFKTGDLVTLDEKGRITVVDRKKDMIIVSGFNVYPTEIEDVLATHPGISEAGIVGESDAEHGEVVKAFVVKINPSLTKEDVIAYCRKELSGYKVPKIIVFVDDLPKTPVGKVLRRELRSELTIADKMKIKAA